MNETNTAVTTIPKGIPSKILTRFESDRPQITTLLPQDLPVARFQAGLWLQFSLTPKLAECTDISMARAIIKAATKGLEPGRDCCILPFKNMKGGYTEATMVEEYQGVLRRLDRTGRVVWAKAEPVFQRDHFVCDELSEVYEFRRHLGGDRGPLVAYFAAVKLKGADKPIVRVCTIDEVDEVKRVMGRGEYDAWVKWPHEMGRKTAIKKLAKYLQLIDDQDEHEPGGNDFVPDERARQNIVELWGDEKPFHAHQDAPETANATHRDQKDTETSEGHPVAPQAEFISKVVHHCQNHDFEATRVLALASIRYKVDHPNELSQGQQRVVLSWLTSEGGRKQLERSLREEAGAIDAFLAGEGDDRTESDDIPEPEMFGTAAEGL
jgi:recombination protein RecT